MRYKSNTRGKGGESPRGSGTSFRSLYSSPCFELGKAGDPTLLVPSCPSLESEVSVGDKRRREREIGS